MKRIPGIYQYRDQRTNRTYYSCRHPETKKKIGLGTDKITAIKVFHRLNAEHTKEKEELLWNRISNSDNTLQQYIDKFYFPEQEQRLKDKEIAVNTLKNKKYIINNVLLPRFGTEGIQAIKVKKISELLNEYINQDKRRMAQSIRSCFIDIFKSANAEGWTAENPASLTKNPKAKVKRSRLTLDQFKIIYALAKEDWLKNMMKLAIVTSHAGAIELSLMKRPKKDERYLKIERTKTTERVKLPLDLTLDALGWNLGDVIKECTKTRIISPYLLHHTSDKSNCGKGKKMHHYRLSRKFTQLVRESGIEWGEHTPATLYELRSLSERLYRAQGIDTQTLLAHKDPRSTDGYNDSRGAEWKILEI